MDDDIDYDLFDQYYEVKDWVIRDFLDRETLCHKRQPWEVLRFNKVQSVWNSFSKYGFIRNEKELNNIVEHITENILKLHANTELMGHTSYNPEEDLKEYNLTEDDFVPFYEYAVDENGSARISDYGLSPLLKNLGLLRSSKLNTDKIIYLDQIFNVVHCRSDLASWFIEGGRQNLTQLFIS